MTTIPPPTLQIARFAARAIGAMMGKGEAMGVGVAGKWLAGAAVGSLLVGAALFVLISPQPPSKTKIDGVTVEGRPTTLSIKTEVPFAQCLLTLNSKYIAPARLAPGETYVPWSLFVSEQDVRFDPAVDELGTLTIDCLNPVHGVGLFRFKR